VPDDDAAHDEPFELTNADWGRIHAMAWINDELVESRDPEGNPVQRKFREALEMDPTSAIRHYARTRRGVTGRRLTELRIVRLRPEPCDIPNEFWEDVNPFPPSCC
jgi:hypothetical protein